MTSAPKLLFVLTDGGHARLVERSHETGRFVTLEEIRAAGRLEGVRHAPAAGTEGQSRAKTAFVGEAADRAADLCARRGMEGAVAVAPPRLINPLSERLGQRVRLAGAVRKDLTKVADADLGAWLNHIFSDAQPVG